MKKIAFVLLCLACEPTNALDCSALFAAKSNKPVKAGQNPTKHVTGPELNAMQAKMIELCAALNGVIATQGSSGGGSSGGGGGTTPPVIPTPTATCTPLTGNAGTSVTCSGTALNTTTAATFNGKDSSQRMILSDNMVALVAPEGVSSGDIVITTQGGTANGGRFVVVPVVSLPSAPTSLVATAAPAPTNATDRTSIALTWTEPTGSPTSYVLTIRDNLAGSYVSPAGGYVLTAPVASYTATNLTQGRNYTFVLYAQNGAGAGPTAQTSATTNAYVPPAPTPGSGLYVCKPSQCPNASDENAGIYTQPLATIYRALRLVRPGETIYLRGGTTDDDVKPNPNDSTTWYAADPNTVWDEVLHWPNNHTYSLAGMDSDGAPNSGDADDGWITIQCYPGEKCRLQPSRSQTVRGWYYTDQLPYAVIYIEGSNDGTADNLQPRYIRFKDLVIDSRNVTYGNIRATLAANSVQPSYMNGAYGPHHIEFDNVEFRYSRRGGSLIGGHDWHIVNSWVHDIGTETGYGHGAGFYIEGRNMVIEDSLFENYLGQGVKVNNDAVNAAGDQGADPSGNIIRRNIFRNGGRNPFNGTRQCWNTIDGQQGSAAIGTQAYLYCPNVAKSDTTTACTCDTEANHYGPSILVSGGHAPEIRNNTIENSIFTGILLSGGTYDAVIDGNTLTNNASQRGYGIRIDTSPGGYSGQYLQGSADVKTGVARSSITNNILTSNGGRGNTAPNNDISIIASLAGGVTLSGNTADAVTAAETPTITPNGGTFTTTQSVNLSCGSPTPTIKYTTDGSTPTNSSSAYSTALSLSATTTVKAICQSSGLSDSSVASATFTKSGGTTLTAGVTTQGGSATSPVYSEKYTCQQMTMTSTGTINSFSVYLGAVVGTLNLKAVLYNDAGTQPGTPIGISAETASPVAGWNTLPVAVGSVTSGNYWICVTHDGGTGEYVTFAYNSSGSPKAWTSPSPQDYATPPNMTSLVGTVSSGDRSFYLTYTP